MKEQIDRLTEKLADELHAAAGADSVVVVLVADATDMHVANRGETFRRLGALKVYEALIMNSALLKSYRGDPKQP